ncbi:glycosyltransferase family 2 protein [Halovulum sp. GXIMD14793]
MPATPSVSVIIPTYKDPVRVIEAIESVRAQGIDDLEIIVVDDGSGEEVQTQIAQNIAALDDKRIRPVLSGKNRGPGRSRNIGLRLARGRYLAFLDSDDLWRPEKLTKQLAAMASSNAVLSCTGYENLDEATGQVSSRIPPAEMRYETILYGNPIGCSTVILDREKVGRSYFPDLPMRQDYAHWLSLLRRGHGAIGLPELLTTRRIVSTALSANKLKAARHTWRVFRNEEKMGLLKSLRCFTGYFLNATVFKK